MTPGQSPLRLATIDIGSNAVRMFVGQKSPGGRIRVLEDMRASVRLGHDAFSVGYIRPATIDQLEYALKEFRAVCDHWQVETIRAVGTSALRDSKNAREVIDRLKAETGLNVRLIDGQLEAALLHKAVAHVVDLSQRSALLLDMGGGSLEVALSRKARLVTKISLPLGTVRLISRVAPKPTYETFAELARTPLYRLRWELLGAEQKPLQLVVGTGGNLRALAKLCYRLHLSRARSRFKRTHLEILTRELFKLSLAQRTKRFGLRVDRADVILPAAAVTLEMMRIFEIDEIQAPNVGLKNGLFWDCLDRSRLKDVPRKHLTRRAQERRRASATPKV